ESQGIDISDDGKVLVRVTRPYDANIVYVGGPTASYIWTVGSDEPHWTAQPDGTVSRPGGTMLFVQVSGTHNGHEILDGVQGLNPQTSGPMPFIRYRDPDNANETAFPCVGGVVYDVETYDLNDAAPGNHLWQEVPADFESLHRL